MAFPKEALDLIARAEIINGKPFTDAEVAPIAYELWMRKGRPQQGPDGQKNDWNGAETILAARTLLGLIPTG